MLVSYRLCAHGLPTNSVGRRSKRVFTEYTTIQSEARIFYQLDNLSNFRNSEHLQAYYFSSEQKLTCDSRNLSDAGKALVGQNTEKNLLPQKSS